DRRPSRRSCRVTGSDAVEREVLTEVPALRQRRYAMATPAQRPEEYLRITESRQQQQRRATRLEMPMQPLGETLPQAIRPPGTVAVVARLAGLERRVEQYEVEALPDDRLEEIAMAHVDRAFGTVDERVDPRATHGRSVDVDRDDPAGMPRREHRAHSRAGTHVQHFRLWPDPTRVELRDEELPRPHPLRIENAGRHEYRSTVYVLDDEFVVAVEATQVVKETQQLDERAGGRGKADRGRGVRCALCANVLHHCLAPRRMGSNSRSAAAT